MKHTRPNGRIRATLFVLLAHIAVLLLSGPVLTAVVAANSTEKVRDVRGIHNK
jgi:hypothetical protein